MRYTKNVSIWPVGFAGQMKVESPICNEGKVVGFHTGFQRKFAVDMAGKHCNKLLLSEIVHASPGDTTEVTDFMCT